MVISDYLRECGYNVIEATGAEEAMKIFSAGRKIDAVFCEVKLQGEMDGFALAQWIRTNHPQMEVILTTEATATAEKAGEMCEEGPLEKPYHPQHVVQRLKILFERRRQARVGPNKKGRDATFGLDDGSQLKFVRGPRWLAICDSSWSRPWSTIRKLWRRCAVISASWSRSAGSPG